MFKLGSLSFGWQSWTQSSGRWMQVDAGTEALQRWWGGLASEVGEDGGDNGRFQLFLDKAHSYRGEPAEIVSVLQATPGLSRPLAALAIAYLHTLLAYRHRPQYDELMLVQAQAWLGKAQTLLPEAHFGYHLVAARVAGLAGGVKEAREHLEKLDQLAPNTFYTKMAWVEYYAWCEDLKQMIYTYRQATKVAMTTVRKMHMRHLLGQYLTWFGYPELALNVYRELAELRPYDAWLWHYMSINHLRQQRLRLATHCNQNSLSLLDFTAARGLQRQIRSEWMQRGMTWVGGVVIVVGLLWLMTV